TGHDGALDTTLANARVEFAGASGYLVFDVSGTTQAGAPVALKDVRLAQFSADAAQVAGATVTLTGVSVTLTDAGAAAFGTY
ncbi:HtaA domain-containing protein, partial [Acinetobacter baumannii]